MNDALYWVNGRPAGQISAADRAVQYGDGLFETLRVRASRAEFLERHIRRLAAGCERLQLPTLDRRLVRQELTELAARQGDAVVKLIVSRGPGGRGYRFFPGQEVTRIVSVHPLPGGLSASAQAGVRVRVCATRLADQPLLAGIKHLNRLEQVLARAEWTDAAIAEGLMLNYSEQLIEGTMSNVFMVRDDVLLTPELANCGVAGVMRSVILDLAKELGVRTQVCRLGLHDTAAAREVFLCNSLIGIWPVVSIDGVGSFEAGHLTRRLQAALHDYDRAGDGNWYLS